MGCIARIEGGRQCGKMTLPRSNYCRQHANEDDREVKRIQVSSAKRTKK